MTILEFIAASLWPIVVLVVFLSMRNSLHLMAERINPTKVDVFGFKAEFDARLEKAEILTTDPENSDDNDLEIAKHGNNVLSLEKPPSTRILRSWNRLARFIMRAPSGERRTAAEVNWTKPDWVSQAATDLELTADEIAAIKELQALRNRVAHSNLIPVSSDDAERFEAVAHEIRGSIFSRLDNKEN